ncbi:MAG: DNA topoisomerase VI subunit B [Phycisphaerales bacterium]|jgi:DNA topoisomerase-6 subunit B
MTAKEAVAMAEPRKKKTAPRADAESMAARQRDISVSEFFAKNRHLLGFDNPRKAVLTTVKEAVDNSLDACEEAGILPEIAVILEDLEPNRPATAKSSRYRITVIDNGPGIVRKQVENIFGRLLYGSKFHRLKMSRGQQGIGISAAGMYGLITTGRPMTIFTKPKAGQPTHHIELAMNTKTNRAEVTFDKEVKEFPPRRFRDMSAGTKALAEQGGFLTESEFPTGTSVSIELDGKYQKGRGSVDEFLELTAIANPHARIVFVPPTRVTEDEEPDVLAAAEATAAAKATVTTETNGVIVFPRGVQELPPETREIQPHPKGIELGILLQMLKDYELAEKGGTLYNFLQERFCRVSPQTAASMCQAIGVSSRAKAGDIEPPQAEKLYKVFQESKLAPPPTDCLAPIGVRQLLAGMLKGVRAEFYSASSRTAEVYRGRPFQIEAAIAFGGELPADESARVIRFANRVPLLFQQSACSSFKAVTETAWKNYNLQQPRGALPVGPLVIMIHMASVWVPFTSESKEAIADYDEIRKEMKLALMECGRKLGTYLRKRQKMRREGERRDVFERYIGEISKAIHEVTGEDQRKVFDALLKQAKARTAVADHVLDEDGRIVKDEPMDEDGVIVVPGAIAPVPGAIPAAAPVAEAAPTKGARRRAAEGTDSRRAAKPGKASAAREELRARVAKSASRGKGGPAAPGLF